MKKNYLLIIISVLILSLFGCDEHPKQTVVYERAPEVKDTTTPSYKMDMLLQEVKDSLSKRSLDYFPLDSSQISAINELPEEIFNKIIDMVCSFDYQIIEQNIDGNDAIVKVAFTSYDFVSTIKKVIVNITKDSILSSIMSSNKSVEDLIIENVSKSLEKLEETGREKTIVNDFRLHLENNEWVFDMNSNVFQLLDGITGGLMSSLSELEELINKFY